MIGINPAAVTNKIAPNLLPLTPEEQSLLDAYSEVKALEKLSAQAASDAAKAVLIAADEEYQRKSARENGVDPDLGGGEMGNGNMDVDAKKKKRKKRKKAKTQDGSGGGGGGGSSMLEANMSSDDGSEYYSEDDEEVEAEKERRRQKKLDQLRDDVEEKLEEEHKNEQNLKQQEDHRRELLLVSSAHNESDMPSLQRKRDFDRIDKPPTSLIANMDHMSTPTHDFSKDLKMSRVSGTQLFPPPRPITPSSASESIWSPSDDAQTPDEGCLEFELPNFDPDEAAEGRGNNTLGVKFSAPKDSKRFSINIAAPDHDNYYSVLFHFNPRQFEKGGQVVINDKKSGIWGQAINIPLLTFPLMFGEASTTLIVQINSEGFDVFVNNRHCARLEHRVPLSRKAGPFMLQLPSTDDSGRTEKWSVYKVWWGNKELMASDDISHVAGVNTHSALHEKKLFISGLQKISTEAQVDLRRAELERAFRKYGGNLGVTVKCPTNCSFAFVEVESYRAADMAIREMSGKYMVNRARISKHEFLESQRAAKAEATSRGADKEDNEWS